MAKRKISKKLEDLSNESVLLETDLSNKLSILKNRDPVINPRTHTPKSLKEIVAKKIVFNHYFKMIKEADTILTSLIKKYSTNSLSLLSAYMTNKEKEGLSSLFFNLYDCEDKIPIDLKPSYNGICEEYAKVILGGGD